jgi:hypothetical protein
MYFLWCIHLFLFRPVLSGKFQYICTLHLTQFNVLSKAAEFIHTIYIYIYIYRLQYNVIKTIVFSFEKKTFSSNMESKLLEGYPYLDCKFNKIRLQSTVGG